MPGSSFFALLDDIASILDDVSILTKVAAKKTAGVLGDDLALNAQQVTGVNADRELPVVWAVAKGSGVNKLILIPLALVLSVALPWLVVPLLMFGGAFLCFEGVEKLAHKFLHSKEEDEEHHKEHLQHVADEKVDIVAAEKEKIKGAIRTDFVLSAEIVAIALGEVATKSFGVRVAVLSAIGVLMTIGVYGLVACIVKLDDLGLYLSKKESKGSQSMGRGILWFAPFLLKFLSVAGTVAMFLVGGGIIVHGIGFLHHFIDGITIPLVPAVLNALVGVVVGIIALILVTIATKLFKKKKPEEAKAA